jgi:hypothetical protein
MMDEKPDPGQKSEHESQDQVERPIPPKAKKKELTIISTPDDDVMDQEMADLFDEDRVTHQHGGTQPEKD